VLQHLLQHLQQKHQQLQDGVQEHQKRALLCLQKTNRHMHKSCRKLLLQQPQLQDMPAQGWTAAN
jgi:hypothetical protein